MDFSKALETRVDDIEKPAVLPQGTYTWSVIKIPAITHVNSAKGDWDVVEFNVRPVSAEDDVDPDQLAAYGNISSAFGRISFMFPTEEDRQVDRDRTMFNLKRFLETTLRVDAGDNATMRELLDGSVNCQFLASAVWRIVGEDVYLEVKNYAPLD